MRGPSRHDAVTLGDVASRAQVSSMTVSNALHHPDRLTPETLERVRAAIDELGYKPNRSARTLRSKTSGLIGVRVQRSRDDRAALLLDQFLHALAESAAGRGYHLILSHAYGDAAELAAYQELRQTTAVDAFVLTGAHRDDARMAWMRERGIAFATFGRSWDDALDQDRPWEHPWVDVDGAAGLRAAVEHLAVQGHQEIALLGWPDDSDVGNDRRRGWLEGCQAMDLPARVEAHVVDEFDAARDAAHRLLAGRGGAPVPTAVVCVSDTLALGVVRALVELGLRPGVDVAVTGFDNSPSAALGTPGLTSVAQPLDAVAHEIVRIVEARVGGLDVPRPQVLLTPTLVVRESSQTR